MALAEAILVCLTERPMSGYDLAKYFDVSIGFFWKATHPQIYRELKKLSERGHVEPREIVQSGKPNRIVYSITASGRAALLEWSRTPVASPVIKDELLVRMQAIEHVDEEMLVRHVKERLANHREQLEQYEHIRRSRFEGAVEAKDLGKLMGLELGIEYEKGWITWCDRVLERLSGEKVARKGTG